MAGPTTEVPNDDINELKAEVRDVRSSLGTLKTDVHAIAISLAELRGEFGLAKWILGLVTAATLGGIGAGIWWAGSITADVRHLEAQFDKFDSRFGRMEQRFDRLDEALTKARSQASPAAVQE